MKIFKYIFLFGFFLLSVQGFSINLSANDPNSKPSLSLAGNTNEDGVAEPKAKDNSANTEEESKELESKADTLSNYNSSCKFNFLFYFIYKVKYDENGELESGVLDFEF